MGKLHDSEIVKQDYRLVPNFNSHSLNRDQSLMSPIYQIWLDLFLHYNKTSEHSLTYSICFEDMLNKQYWRHALLNQNR
jgi:hypothetical protein